MKVSLAQIALLRAEPRWRANTVQKFYYWEIPVVPAISANHIAGRHGIRIKML